MTCQKKRKKKKKKKKLPIICSNLMQIQCDEDKPICGSCALRGVSCHWPTESASQQHDLTWDQSSPGIGQIHSQERIASAQDQSHPVQGIEPSPVSRSLQPLYFNVHPSVAGPGSLGSEDRLLNMFDLQMHSHFMLHTSKNMSLDPRRRHVWERVVPQLATRHKALMHLLLSLAGLDLFSSNGSCHVESPDDSPRETHWRISNTTNSHTFPVEDPTRRRSQKRDMDVAYLPVVVGHHQQGVKAMREELSNLSRSNIHYVFAGSLLIAGFALASLHIRNVNDVQPSNSQTPRPRLDWIYLIQGLGTLVQQHWADVRVGPLRDMTHFIYNNDDWRMYPRQSYSGIRPRCQFRSERLSSFCDGAYEALTNLKSFHESRQSDLDLLQDPAMLSRRSRVLSSQKEALTILDHTYMRTLHMVCFSGGEGEPFLGVQADLDDAAILAWPQALPREFLATLQESEMLSNFSYVILAYFHLVSSLLNSFWYIKGGFDEEIVKINALIAESEDPVLISFMQWPASVICF